MLGCGMSDQSSVTYLLGRLCNLYSIKQSTTTASAPVCEELELVVPDDEVGVAVVDLGEVRGLVPVEVSPPPLDVAPPTHQRRHRPLHRLVLGLARVLPTLALSLVVLGQGLGLGARGSRGFGG